MGRETTRRTPTAADALDFYANLFGGPRGGPAPNVRLPSQAADAFLMAAVPAVATADQLQRQVRGTPMPNISRIPTPNASQAASVFGGPMLATNPGMAAAVFGMTGGPGGGGDGGGNTQLTPQAKMMTRLRQKGYSDAVIAGVLGNVQHESSWDPSRTGDSGTAFGYFQHRGDRVMNFQKVTGVHPSRATPEQAADFFDWEMRNPAAASMKPEWVEKIRNAKGPQEAAMLIQQYYERPKVVDPARGATAMTLAQKLNMQFQGGAALPTGFNGALFDPALQAMEQAQKAAMTPWSAEVAQGPRPEMPEDVSGKLPTKDYTEQDKLLAGLAPEAFDPAEGEKLKRRRLWQGMAQGLASLPEGAGVGAVLARVGAGMLGGRLAADDEIAAKAEEYDQKMREYNLLKLNYEDGKANQKFAEATQAVASAQDYAWKKFNVESQYWAADNTVDMQGGQLIVKTRTKDGQVKVTGTPITSLVMPGMLMQEASLRGQIASAENQANQGNAGLVASMMVQAGVAEAQEGNPTGMLTAGASYAAQAIDYGFGAEIFGNEWTVMQEEATRAAREASPGDPEAQAEARKNFLIGKATQYLLTNPQLQERLAEKMPTLKTIEQGKASTSVREKTGNRTVTTRVP